MIISDNISKNDTNVEYDFFSALEKKTVSYRPIVWTRVSYLEHTEGSGEGKLTKLSARFHTKPSSLPDETS